MMDPVLADLARRAAAHLAPETDRNLPALVEAQLQGGGAPSGRYEAATAIALASLIISAAQFARDIYRDLKKDPFRVSRTDGLASGSQAPGQHWPAPDRRSCSDLRCSSVVPLG